jgi:hypothetical protein
MLLRSLLAHELDFITRSGAAVHSVKFRFRSRLFLLSARERDSLT